MWFKNQVYDYSMARRTVDILPELFLESLGVKMNEMYHLPCRNRRFRNTYLRKVFYEFLLLMIHDCIENDVRFVAPGRENFIVYIKEKHENEQIKLRASKAVYQTVDLIKSNGKFYEFFLRSSWIGYPTHRKIRISRDMYYEIIDKVNNGKRYASPEMVSRRVNYYLPQLMIRFPDLNKKILNKIIGFGCYKILDFLKDKDDVLIETGIPKLKFLIYQFRSLVEERKRNEAKRGK